MIETLEVLLREYELNSIDNNNSYTVKNRNAKKRDAPTSENLSPVPEQSASGSPEAFDPRLGAFMAHLGVPNLQLAPSEPKPSSSESQPPTSTPSLPLFIGSKNITECMSTMVLAKGEHIGRGHTAYLTFATKIHYSYL